MTPHVAGAHATAQLAVLEACMSGGRGDRSEACVEPEPGWMSDRDGDWRADRDDERNDRTLWGGAA